MVLVVNQHYMTDLLTIQGVSTSTFCFTCINKSVQNNDARYFCNKKIKTKSLGIFLKSLGVVHCKNKTKQNSLKLGNRERLIVSLCVIA